jgi:Xaa-Pro dipeptidase
VVTVEPGFYIIDQLLNEAKARPIGKLINWSRVEQLRPFGGIRIEDNVVARPGGQENLTRRAFANA